jgi:hypothetical protein
MPELDFAGLRTVAEDAVRQPEFAAIERLADRRRGRRRLAAGMAAAIAVVSIGGTTALAVDRAAPDRPDAGVSVSRPPGSLLYYHAVDGDHLYLTFVCATGDCQALYASDDGGRTWQPRTLPASSPVIGGLVLLGPRALYLVVPEHPGATPFVSLDGGVTWRPQDTGPTPVQTLPVGQRLFPCYAARVAEPCTVTTLDAEGRAAPLAHQPSIDVHRIGADRPADAGLWVTGIDRQSRRPALAVSRDLGLTWDVTVFAKAAPVTPEGGYINPDHLPDLSTADGRTAYVRLSGLGVTAPLYYRTTDGAATWRPLEPGPDGGPLRDTFVTRDGAHVRFGSTMEGLVVTRASRDGGPYVPAHLSGIPGDGLVAVPTPLGGGHGYVARAVKDNDTLYVSEDGWTYRRLDLP